MIGRAALGTAKVVAGLLLTASPLAQLFGKAAPASLELQAQADRPKASAWPQEPKARAGAPNILIIMTDDVGFGASAVFGGAIPTPTLQSLANDGLRYTRFNTTGLCSPTRAALLTGMNPHRVGMGNVTNRPTGFPGYNTLMPKSARTMAEILKRGGYNTAMFGKAHLTPDWEMSVAGPFDRWPTGLGFEYFYGFLSADTSMWEPDVVENTTHIAAPSDDPGYHFEKDMADKAIEWLNLQNAVAPDKPYFLYYAPGLAHAPHHAPKDWLDRFRGRFDQGWDNLREETFAQQKRLGIIPADAELTPRPPSLPAWSSLSVDQRRLYCRLMEAFAASVAYSDYQTGRVIDQIRKSGEYANTLIIYIEGDNGGSAEGGLNGLLYEQSTITGRSELFSDMLKHIDDIGGREVYNHFPAAWAWATNAPFPFWKQVASQTGGVRNGMVVSWPSHIADHGGLRAQYSFVTDIMPTVLEAAGMRRTHEIDGIRQLPLDGISLGYSFSNRTAPSKRQTQIFEIMENFGIYQNGWVAGTLPKRNAWDFGTYQRSPTSDIDQRKWTLFNINEDYSTARDLAASNPDKLRQMQRLFFKEAERNNILPIHDSSVGREGVPSLGAARTHFRYQGVVTNIPEDAAPHTIGKSFTIDADVDFPKGTERGVLVAHGGRFGGYSFYVHDRKLVFHYNAIGADQFRIVGDLPAVAGPHRLVAKFVSELRKPGSPGKIVLTADGTEIARGRVSRTIKGRISHSEGFDIGRDTVTPVSDDYQVSSSAFQGVIRNVSMVID